jgi:hypothetical protein
MCPKERKKAYIIWFNNENILFIDFCSKKNKIGKAVLDLEEKLESKRREDNLIGTVVETKETSQNRFYVKQLSINFSWQRGFKIGKTG